MLRFKFLFFFYYMCKYRSRTEDSISVSKNPISCMHKGNCELDENFSIFRLISELPYKFFMDFRAK